MPSSYTSSLRLTLPLTGELTGTWGDTVNSGITSLVDSSVAGTAAITLLDANYTLSVADGVEDESRKMFVIMTGTLTATRNVICPAASKLYFVRNSTTGGFAVTFKTSAGTGVSIPSGATQVALYCDGTNVVDATNYISSLKLGAALPVLSGGTGQTSFADGQLLIGNTTGNTLSKSTLTAGAGISVTNGAGSVTIANTTLGTVTSVDVSGGTTGLTTSGGPITGSGTVTLAGTLAATNGGTGLTSLGAGIATFLGTPSSANLAAAVTNETGTGALVFGTSPTLVTPVISSIVNTGTLSLPTSTDTLVARATTDTLTNKRVNPRAITAPATSGTLTIGGDTTDLYIAEGLTGAITFAQPSGTPVNGQKLLIRIKDNGTVRGITWTTSAGAFREVGITLPTTTVLSKVTYVGCVYNGTDSFWDAVATVTQA
jgi:hypothetical protein